MKNKEQFDVIIVGGGPAGLNAALILGRCLRKVLVFDDHNYRNKHSHAVNGFLTRDGTNPIQLRKIAHKELKKYETVKLIHKHVEKVLKIKNGFKVISQEKIYYARKILLATGRKDVWPKIKGAKKLYGVCIFPCPYCDGFEWREKPLAVYCKRTEDLDYALTIHQWSKDIILLTDGPLRISKAKRDLFAKYNIEIIQDNIVSLRCVNGKLDKIVFDNFEIKRKAIFFNKATFQKSELAFSLGSTEDKNHCIKNRNTKVTHMKGLFVAGDSCYDVYQAISSAGNGAQAAIHINHELTKDDHQK